MVCFVHLAYNPIEKVSVHNLRDNGVVNVTLDIAPASAGQCHYMLYRIDKVVAQSSCVCGDVTSVST